MSGRAGERRRQCRTALPANMGPASATCAAFFFVILSLLPTIWTTGTFSPSPLLSSSSAERADEFGPGFGERCASNAECEDCQEKGCECDCGPPITCNQCTYPDEYVVAAQIALGAGLVFVLTTLAVLLCKSYLKWRVQRLTGSHELDAASLDTIDRRVLSQLRDRPPRYDEAITDKAPAYNTALRETPFGDAPPPYSEVVPADTAFSQAAIRTPLRSGELSIANSGTSGTVNPAFVPDEQPLPSPWWYVNSTVPPLPPRPRTAEACSSAEVISARDAHPSNLRA